MRHWLEHHRQRSLLGAATVATAALVLQTSAVQAQEMPWRVECGSDGEVLNCSAIQEATRANERRPFAAVAVRKDPDNKTFSMLIQVPLGVNLLEPMQFRVDNGPTEKRPFETCTSAGCFASLRVGTELMAAMRRGAVLKLMVEDAGKRPITVDVSLTGFSQAVDKTR